MQDNFNFTAKLQNGTQSALNWILRSIEVNRGAGSSAYFSRLRHPWNGWAPAYPETTGYIIETLLNYHTFRSDLRLVTAAKTCADWLVDIQMSSGAFTGLFVKHNTPSIFNTAQILFGLRHIYIKTSEEKYLIALKSALQWLENQLDVHGNWQSGNYVQGFVPTYYTRVLWPMLLCYQFLEKTPPKKVIVSLKGLQAKVLPNFAIVAWAFEPNIPAVTHTIAYTLRGFWECGLLLKDDKCFTIVENAMSKLLTLFTQNGQLAGSYDKDWIGDDTFQCLTGNAQLSIIAHLLYERTQQQSYLNFSIALLKEVQKHQNKLPLKNRQGAIPGSAPFGGKYLPFRFPNWAAKFYLDAALAHLIA